MPRQTKFRSEWLEQTDRSGKTIGLWCVKGKDDFHGFCSYCKTDVATGNSGKVQLLQHASTSKHKKITSVVCDASQTKFKKVVSSTGESGVDLDRGSSVAASKMAVVPLWSLKDEEKVCRSEILWTLNVAVNNYSFSSCNGVNDLFREMFPGSVESQGMKLSARKIAYEISHGLGPYFLMKTMADINKTRPLYTIMYDETLNEANNKQLDLYIRYWSSQQNRITECYIGSELLGHATSIDIDSAIMTRLQLCNLQLAGMLMLGSDGPNVNKAVFKIMNKRLCQERSEGLVNIGTCNLHIVHNAFGEGLKMESFGEMIDFLEDVDVWFRKYPSRKADFQLSRHNADMDDTALSILRHVSNRWLSVVPVCKRILQLLPALQQHFLVDLPKDKNKSRLLKLDRCKRIKKMLNSHLTLSYLHFLFSVGSLFEHFLTFLQQKGTLIHLLYDEIISLVRKIMFRFLDMEKIKDMKGEDLLNIPVKEEAQKHKDIDVGVETKKSLRTLSQKDKGYFLVDAKNFYINITLYLLNKLPLKNKLLQCLQILHPLSSKVLINSSLSSIRCLATLLPQAMPISNVDKLCDEWRLYVTDSDIVDKWSREELTNKWKPIDYYWHKVFSLVNETTQSCRYPYLTVLVKAALCLSHGQASIERGFSVNKRMLTADRSSMSQATIIGLRLIKDAVRGKISEVDITREMVTFYREAHAKYKAESAEKDNKQKITKNQLPLEKEVKPSSQQALKTLREEISAAQIIIEEGNNRLQMALKRKSMDDIAAAHALIEAGNKRLKMTKPK